MSADFRVDARSRDAAFDLLDEWYARSRAAKKAHYSAARAFSRLHFGIGVPVVVLAAAAGTSSFATFARDGSGATGALVVGLVSLCAAVFAALQTFLKYSERSQSHKSTGARYASVCREIELLQAHAARGDDPMDALLAVKERLDALSEEAPGLRQSERRQMKRDWAAQPRGARAGDAAPRTG